MDAAGGGIVIPIMINGKEFKAAIDSGSTGDDLLTLSNRLGSELQLTPESYTAANAYGGTVRLGMVTLAWFRIGGMTLTNQRVSIAPGPVDRDGVDVIVGQKLLLGMLLQVEWDKRRLRLLLTGDMPQSANGTPTLIDGRTKHLVVPAAYCGIERQLVLDSGLEDDATIVAVDPPVPELRRRGAQRHCIHRPGRPSRPGDHRLALASDRIPPVRRRRRVRGG